MITWTLLPLAVCLTMTAGCASQEPPRAQRQRLIRLLESQARSNTGWVRVHAADALLDHGQRRTAASLLGPEADTAAPPYRIGVWRVLARAAGTAKQRQGFAARIRRVLLDPQSPDRLHAAESLAKLGLVTPAERPAIEQWLAAADEATSAFLRWLLVQSSNSSQWAGDEARLAGLLTSTDSMARLRAAFALGRIHPISTTAFAELAATLKSEPADSPARPYLIAAVLLHTPRDSAAAADLRGRLAAYLDQGKPSEQLEAATVLGRCGSPEQRPELTRLLEDPQADAQIGAANGLLYLLE